MKRKANSCVILLLFIINVSIAQTGKINGWVKTADGGPAESVSITVKGLRKGASTDKSGYYEISALQPGSYTLTAALVGLESQEQTVQVKSEEYDTPYLLDNYCTKLRYNYDTFLIA